MRLRAILALVLLPVALQAQTVSTGFIQWDQPVPVGETIMPPAYEYRLIVDGKPDVAIKQTCVVNPTPDRYLCEAPLPTLPTGGHTLTIFARVNLNGANYPTTLSNELPLISLVIEVPQNLRLKKPL